MRFLGVWSTKGMPEWFVKEDTGIFDEGVALLLAEGDGERKRSRRRGEK